MCRKSPAKIFGIAILVLVGISAFGALTMLLWNWLIPTVFGGPSVTYFQALGLLLLSKILFSGGPGKHDKHSHSGPPKRVWKKHLMEKMESETNQDIESVKE